MVGASIAFFGPPAARSMHSHITGVLPGLQSHGLGRVLKRHQRDWAFARDVGHITWTFDPLVARNAHFNLRVLGARVTEYLVDHYGPMDDGVNRGDETDRVMVSWALAAPPAPTPARRAGGRVGRGAARHRVDAPRSAGGCRGLARPRARGVPRPAGGGPGRRRASTTSAATCSSGPEGPDPLRPQARRTHEAPRTHAFRARPRTGSRPACRFAASARRRLPISEDPPARGIPLF